MRLKFVVQITSAYKDDFTFQESDTHLSYNKLSFWVSGKIAIDWPKIYLRNFLRAETYLEPSRTSMMEVFHIVNGYKPL